MKNEYLAAPLSVGGLLCLASGVNAAVTPEVPSETIAVSAKKAVSTSAETRVPAAVARPETFKPERVAELFAQESQSGQAYIVESFPVAGSIDAKPASGEPRRPDAISPELHQGDAVLLDPGTPIPAREQIREAREQAKENEQEAQKLLDGLRQENASRRTEGDSVPVEAPAIDPPASVSRLADPRMVRRGIPSRRFSSVRVARSRPVQLVQYPRLAQMPAAADFDPRSSTPTTMKITSRRLEFRQAFTCGFSEDAPVTLMRVNHRDIPVLLWTSREFEKAGFDPKRRCREVTQRLDDYNTLLKDGKPLYLTTGKVNGQTVICVTNAERGACGDGIFPPDGLLLTLAPGTDAKLLLRQIFDALQVEEAAAQKPLDV